MPSTPITATAGSDSCGIVVADLGVDGRGYVIGDRTIQGREPAVWAHAAVAAYHDYRADRIVVETNQGGDLVVQVFRTVERDLPVKKVYASRGKYLRAEPISVLYAQGRVAHVGEFPELERQMCDFAADGLSNGKSPDRLDALVWALTELMLTSTRQPLTVDHVTGIVTFLAGHIPAASAAITAGYEFDVPVRFDSDKLDINIQGVHHGAVPSNRRGDPG